MNSVPPRRGTEFSQETTGPYFTVVLIGELLSTHPYPLSPLTPSDHLPFALLPICNTPIINYALENLAENGVNKVCILLNSNSVEPVRRHLQNSNTARGKKWLESKDMAVKIIESNRTITRIHDATSEITHHNIVGQNSSFLIAPIDEVAFFKNLRDFFQIHLRRTETINKYTATVLCTSVRSALKDNLHDVLLNRIEKLKRYSNTPSPLDGDRDSVDDISIHAAKRCPLKPPEVPPNHITMLKIQKSTGVVKGLTRFKKSEDFKEPIKIEFSGSEHISVRTDLVTTGFLFCSGEALSLFGHHLDDDHPFFVDLLANEEIFGNVFGIQVVSPSMGIIRPIKSLKDYIQLNIDMCCRHLFPLRREYIFTENMPSYAVSLYDQTVYLHQDDAKVLSNECKPCVVVGAKVKVPRSAKVCGTMLGNGVKIGEGTEIIGCIILDGAEIGENCVLHHSLIGRNSEIGKGVKITDSIINEGCKILGTSLEGSNNNNNNNNNKSSITVLPSVVVEGRAIDKSLTFPFSDTFTSTGTDTNSSNSNNSSLHHSKEDTIVFKKKVMPTWKLFIQDKDPKSESDEGEISSEDESEEDEIKFREELEELVDQALERPSLLPHCLLEMKETRRRYERNIADLCRIVTERLLEHVGEQYHNNNNNNNNNNNSRSALESAQALLSQWCRPFYYDIVRREEEMQAILEATCTALRHSDCPLHRCGPAIMETLYNSCDDSLYDERGYCIVSGEALVNFGERMRRLAIRVQQKKERQQGSYYNNDSSESDNEEEEGMLRVALSCQSYINDVRAFLEEEEEDDDYE